MRRSPLVRGGAAGALRQGRGPASAGRYLLGGLGADAQRPSAILIAAAILVALAVAAPDATASVSPPPAAAEQPVVVQGIEVEGNRRTSAAYVRSLLGVEPGQPFDPASLPALEQRLLNQGIFRTVVISAEPEGSGAILRVRVREKLTVVPIPVVSASSGVFTIGGLLIDSDFLGEGKQAGFGILASNRGASGFVAYRDPSLRFSRWTAGVRLRAADTLHERFEGDSLTYRFRDRRLELGLQGGYRIGDSWTVEAGWVERREEARPSGGFAPPPRAGTLHGPGLAVDLDATRHDDYLVRGVAGRLELRQGVRLGPGDRVVSQAWSTVTWSGRPWRDHGLSLEVSLDWVRGDPVLDAVQLGGAPGSRGFPTEGLWIQDAARAALEYQVPVWKPGWGVLTAVGLCDAGAVRWRGQDTQYLAPGVGFRVYLRNIAIPVVGFDLAWATGLRSPAGSVYFGFRG